MADEITHDRKKSVSLEAELAAAQALNPATKKGPSVLSDLGDLAKAHLYHLKRFYGLTK